MQKIAVRTKKGGVGKSTTAANIGFFLAQQNKSVCLVDIDAQFNLTTMLDYSQDKVSETVLDIIKGKDIYDVAVEVRKNLYLVPASKELTQANAVLNDRPPEITLRRRMQDKEPFDYIIFDCPPGESPLITNVLCYVDEVWAPLQTQFLSLEGLRQVTDEIDANNTDFAPYGVNAKLKWVIPTMHDGRTKLSKEVLEVAQEQYGVIVTNVVRRTVKLEEAPSHGKTIFEYDPKGKGAEDYKRLGEEVLKRG